MRRITFVTLIAGIAAGTSFAGGHEGPFAREIAARQAPMSIMAFNLGILGGMAKGQIDYDAEAASNAAANLLAAASIKQPSAWPEDSDNGFTDGTKALPAIWENITDFEAKQDSLIQAAADLNDLAGDGLEGLRSGLGNVGKNCGACHKLYRQEDQ